MNGDKSENKRMTVAQQVAGQLFGSNRSLYVWEGSNVAKNVHSEKNVNNITEDPSLTRQWNK